MWLKRQFTMKQSCRQALHRGSAVYLDSNMDVQLEKHFSTKHVMPSRFPKDRYSLVMVVFKTRSRQ